MKYSIEFTLLVAAIIMFVLDDAIKKGNIRRSDHDERLGEKEKSIKSLNGTWLDRFIGEVAMWLGILFLIIANGYPVCKYLLKYI